MSQGAQAFDGADHLLTEQLLAFHSELVEIRRRLSEPAPAQPDALALDELVERLRGLLDAQSADALADGGRQVQEYEAEAYYLKVALADELLIDLQGWKLREQWIACPLERRLWDRRSGGVTVLDRIDQLLLKDPVPARRGMALQYLLALSMGFQGTLRDKPDGRAKLQGMRRDLYRFSFREEPHKSLQSSRLAEDPDLARSLLPQAYAHTAFDADHELLADPRRWVALFVVLALLLLGVSQIVWDSNTAPLSEHFARTDAAGGRQ
jgi:type VI secretion system protein ImpK